MTRSPVMVLALLLGVAVLAAVEVGEVVIRTVLPLDQPGITRLRRLVSEDQEAASLLVALRVDADAALAVAPTPIARIDYEGLLNTHPDRIACCEKLADLDRVAAVVEAWAATGDVRYAARALASIEAWAATYRPTGNGINENKLLPLLTGWLMLRSEAGEPLRATVEGWVREMVTLGLAHERARGANWGAKRIVLTVVAGRILGDPALIAEAAAMFRDLVARDLRADGTSADLERRDSMGYHSSCVRSLTIAAIAAGEPDWWSTAAPSGASLERSTRYLLPYATGEKVHKEWVNTTIELDRRRAAAGIEHYRVGRPFDPRDALETIALAAVFLPEAGPIATRLADRPAGSRYAGWLSLWLTALRGRG